MPISVLFFAIFLAAIGADSEKKRGDIDLQSCIDNFDVHKDKIIRTQDSRDMGAKYINEMDLGTREECLRLCCETDNCDVFVFEEKASGSCYLFQCGPPEDFKCKFTHHVNYSSAILAINKHLPDLESQIKLTKHEKDLTQLRKPEENLDENTKILEIATTPMTTPTTKINYIFTPTKDTSLGNKNRKERKCSPFEFECRSTGECIAIYNACDGIPQCTDGSDEAPELKCPEGTTTVSSLKTVYAPKSIQNIVRASNDLEKNPDFIRPSGHDNFIQPPQPPILPYPQIPAQNQNSWMLRQQPNFEPQQFQQYEERNSHIFNHKGNGLQVPEEQSSQSQYNNPYYNGYRTQNQQYQEGYQANLQPQEDQYLNRYGIPVNPSDRRNWPQKPRDLDKVEANTQIRQYNEGEAHESIINHDDHEHEKMAHQLKHSKELMEKVQVESKKAVKKVEKHTFYDQEHAALYKMAEIDLQDGIAETPGGAILSLTLGLIITCVMAILIGCRLRMVRRRLRKGGKSYAHDADYLVNGMYL